MTSRAFLTRAIRLEPMLELRRVTDGNDPAILGFGRLQTATYFEPDMLIPAQYIARMLGWNDNRRQNVLLVIEDSTLESQNQVVAGTLFHHFTQPHSGFSSYLAVASPYRSQGLARRLHDARLEVLMELSNNTLEGVFIDVVNPARLSAEELGAEHAIGSDPTHRLKAFSKLGFKRVNVRYEQPTGGADGGPVTNMDLLFCSRVAVESVSAQLVADTMKSYWLGWLSEARAEREAQALRTRAGGERIALLPLL
jgi:GNAT superfamily N-acetyltransferase